MKKNGFVFIETIIAIVVLTTSLLLLYSTFTKLLQSEKTRVYYDDMTYIYRTWHIKNELKDLNMSAITRELNDHTNKYFITIGEEYEDLFNGDVANKNFISSLLKNFDVNQMIVLKENKIDNIKSCITSNNCPESDITSQLSNDMLNYLKTLYIDVPCYYVLVVEYITCDSADSTNCKNYYSWVSV